MGKLSEEQQKTIHESLWVVNSVLKTLKIYGTPDYKDVRSNAILYMCKCLLRFDESKGVKWTTYAYKSIYLYVLSRYANTKKKESNVVSIENFYSLTCKDTDHDSELANKQFVAKLLKVLSPLEQQIVDYLLKGYTKVAICKELNITRAKMMYAWVIIRDKAKSLASSTPPIEQNNSPPEK